MARNYDTSTRRPWRRIDSTAYQSESQEKLTIAAGAVGFFFVMIAWRYSSKALWALAPGGAGGWALQGLCLALFAGFLWLLDWQVRRKWGWERFRHGIFLGLLAVAAFWVVRLVIWGVVYWIGSKALAPPPA